MPKPPPAPFTSAVTNWKAPRRFSRTLLPGVVAPEYLRDVLGLVSYQPGEARRASFAQGRSLIRTILGRLWGSPGEFLLPPRAQDAPGC